MLNTPRLQGESILFALKVSQRCLGFASLSICTNGSLNNNKKNQRNRKKPKTNESVAAAAAARSQHVGRKHKQQNELHIALIDNNDKKRNKTKHNKIFFKQRNIHGIKKFILTYARINHKLSCVLNSTRESVIRCIFIVCSVCVYNICIY